MSIQPIPIANPPYRPASVSLAFARENYSQWLYLARRSSAPPVRLVQAPVERSPAGARVAGEPAIRYFD